MKTYWENIDLQAYFETTSKSTLFEILLQLAELVSTDTDQTPLERIKEEHDVLAQNKIVPKRKSTKATVEKLKMMYGLVEKQGK